jgi:hypothetical protein
MRIKEKDLVVEPLMLVIAPLNLAIAPLNLVELLMPSKS